MTKLSKAQKRALRLLSENDEVEVGTKQIITPTAQVLLREGLAEVAYSEPPSYESYYCRRSGGYQSHLLKGYTTYRITEKGREVVESL